MKGLLMISWTGSFSLKKKQSVKETFHLANQVDNTGTYAECPYFKDVCDAINIFKMCI